MFRNPFSFKGRIRRREFGISLIIYYLSLIALGIILRSTPQNNSQFLIIACFIPAVWFIFAQGFKRSHDINRSGAWIFVPFFIFWLLIADGNPDANKYGDDPKGRGRKLIDELLADVPEESEV